VSGADTAGGAVRGERPHDAALRRNVRPAEWLNPTPAQRYHLVVIGAGTGGLVTAAIAAALGARVALVERHLMGGDCLNTGCVPSKALLRAARAWAEAAAGRDRFGAPRVAAVGDFPAAMERVRRLRAELSVHDGAARFRDLGVDVFFGDARFVAPDAARVGDATLRFRRAVIATGARPRLPPIPGLADGTAFTTDTIFTLTERPEHVVVIGAGPVGCELAQAFARFGCRVALLDAAPNVLPEEDPEAAAVVQQALQRDGVHFSGGVDITAVERHGEERVVRYRSGGAAHTVTGEVVLVAAGRTPNVEGLGLDAAAVRLADGGLVLDDRLRTTNRRIYAVGDATGLTQFTHAADAHARLVVRNALFWGRGRASRLLIPRCTFTTPELAHVGASAAGGGDGGTRTITIPMRDVDRARLEGEGTGFLRIHLRPGSDRIVGATIVAEHAGELIAQVTQAMRAGIGLATIADTIHAYPTRAEALRKAADAHQRARLTPLARRVLRLLLR
jgi:pyruvate/2-oxoglutarate dehydrogenase complex dihydrolipoamide dehydrogenase (E3) component